MSKIKDSFIDEEPVGYKHVVFSKIEEDKLQKYLEEIDEIKKCWDLDSAKENLFKPLAKAMYGVDSTTKLDKKQVSRVYEELMQMLVDKFPEMDWIDFPSEEQTEQYYESFKTETTR